MKNLLDFTYDELAAEVSAMGERSFRADQLYAWIQRRGARGFEEMTDISKALRARLSREYTLARPEAARVLASGDGTRKILFVLDDGLCVESVLMPEKDRATLCVSTQAGCAMGCLFCRTAAMGPGRNLTLAEMAGQVLEAERLAPEGLRITNVVLMGMGEPLANFDNVARLLEVLTDPRGMAFGARKVTLSTVGLVPAIERLGAISQVNLAVSLNATTDEVRSRLMPVNRRHPIGELIAALGRYPLKRGRRITIEYVMIDGVNDGDDDAARLTRLLRPIPCKVNLIPFNPFEGSRFRPPRPSRVASFHKRLLDAGYAVFTRESRGRDIDAACGQLAARPLHP
ncbi:MAG TPA: 23S rRNA (adenine(2503)-C(2))-methyltransferase RlmN [Deltaproteobacteria bacterium]|nr:23S rRNA (adenine(2503)-C(2))-methyltransferase RlmN [Deltaproteobacteria bacterium]